MCAPLMHLPISVTWISGVKLAAVFITSAKARPPFTNPTRTNGKSPTHIQIQEHWKGLDRCWLRWVGSHWVSERVWTVWLWWARRNSGPHSCRPWPSTHTGSGSRHWPHSSGDTGGKYKSLISICSKKNRLKFPRPRPYLRNNYATL